MMKSDFTYVGSCVRIEGYTAQKDAKRFITEQRREGETWVYAESNEDRVVLLHVEDD